MSSLKTLGAAVAIVFCSNAAAAERSELADIIASCTGRLSAELEFAWLLNTPEADKVQEQRNRFVDILESLGPSEDPRAQLALRIDAKMAHAGLLSQAFFGTDATRATWAKHQAVRQKSRCQNMLLDS